MVNCFLLLVSIGIYTWVVRANKTACSRNEIEMNEEIMWWKQRASSNNNRLHDHQNQHLKSRSRLVACTYCNENIHVITFLSKRNEMFAQNNDERRIRKTGELVRCTATNTTMLLQVNLRCVRFVWNWIAEKGIGRLHLASEFLWYHKSVHIIWIRYKEVSNSQLEWTRIDGVRMRITQQSK